MHDWRIAENSPTALPNEHLGKHNFCSLEQDLLFEKPAHLLEQGRELGRQMLVILNVANQIILRVRALAEELPGRKMDF